MSNEEWAIGNLIMVVTALWFSTWISVGLAFWAIRKWRKD